MKKRVNDHPALEENSNLANELKKTYAHINKKANHWPN